MKDGMSLRSKKGSGRYRGRAFRRKTARMLRNTRQLGRRSKQLIMVAADLVAIPVALWTAVSLRLGTLTHDLQVMEWLSVTAVATTIPVFVRLGLYRAVIRFMGVHAAAAIAIGVCVSTA